MARRAQRARERAARNQAQAPKAPRDAAGSGQRDPEEAADLLDADLRKAAARDLREFRQELSGQERPRSTRRQPESKARRKRRKEARKREAQTAPAPKGALWATAAAASASTAEGYRNGGVGDNPPAYLLALLLLLGLLVWAAVARFAPASPRQAPKRICWSWCLLLGALPQGAGQTQEAEAQREGAAWAGEFWLLLALAAYGLLSLLTKMQTALFGTTQRRRAAQAPARNEGGKRRKPTPLEPVLACTPQGEAYHLPTCGHVKGRPHRILRPCCVCNPLVVTGLLLRQSVSLLVVPSDQVPQVFLLSTQAGDLGVSHPESRKLVNLLRQEFT